MLTPQVLNLRSRVRVNPHQAIAEVNSGMRAGKASFGVIASAALLLAGCENLPSQGPSTRTIVESGNATTSQSANYHLVNLTDETVAYLAGQTGPSLRSSFGKTAPPPRQVLSIGDTLVITLFESSSGGLFFGGDPTVESGARQISFPNQVIGEDGTIGIPYGGRFRAVGSTPAALASVIEGRLDGRAIEPAVIVSVVESTGNSATVMGEVSKSGRIQLKLGGERILSVLADAGITAAENEAVVRLVRNDRLQTVALSTIINQPSENVYVFPGDTIFVLNDPQVYNVMGSVGSPGQYAIGIKPQTFAGALSLAGGLLDAAADAGGVFIFRFETPDVARSLLGPDADLKLTPAGVPMVYRVRFSDPNSFFWLQQLTVHSSDTIYVSTAVTRDFEKFVTIITRGVAFNRTVSSL
jgi:polysaccharide export outer membrane protein